MAKNGISGDNRGIEAVKNRAQVLNTKTNLYVKRDKGTGQFIDVKTTSRRFQGITKEKYDEYKK